jgi:hypothetical protein
LGFVIDVDDAKSLGVTFGPFVVIEEGPLHITSDGDAVLNGAVHGGDVASEILYPPPVTDTAVPIHLI